MSSDGSGISAATTRAPSCSSRSTYCSAARFSGSAAPPTDGGFVSRPTVSPRSRGSGTGAPASTDQASATSCDGASHRPDRVEGGAEREHAVDRDAAPARLQADEPAAGGRQPDRAARVRGEAEVAETGGERRRVAAGRAAGRPAGMRRVLHRPVPRVLARHAPGELVQVRLADDDGARADEALDRRRRPRRHVVGVDLRAVGRADPRGVDQVLDEQALPVQRPRPRRLRLDLGDDRVPVVGHELRSASARIALSVVRGRDRLRIDAQLEQRGRARGERAVERAGELRRLGRPSRRTRRRRGRTPRSRG